MLALWTYLSHLVGMKTSSRVYPLGGIVVLQIICYWQQHSHVGSMTLGTSLSPRATLFEEFVPGPFEIVILNKKNMHNITFHTFA